MACYEGGCVTRFDPQGQVDQYLEVPAKKVTSVHIGGPDLCDIYVASADNTDDPALEGCVFRTRIPVAGQPTPLVKIKV